MAEIVEDGVTGLHFEAGNSAHLADKMQWANEHPEEIICMGKNARRAYEAHYTPKMNYQQLTAIYQQVIDIAKPVRRIRTN
jgi:glycosyltransferase involved in cell wall biosynthesis